MMIIKQAQTLTSLLKSQENSPQEKINDAVILFFSAIQGTDKSQRKDEILAALPILSSVFDLENRVGTPIASQICGSLAENGYASSQVLEDHIKFIKSVVRKVQPLVKHCEEAFQMETNLEVDTETIIDSIIQKHKDEFSAEIEALELLDAYYAGAIAAISFNKTSLAKAKQELGDVFKYEKYSIGFLWISKLLTVLIDEPFIAIDLTTHKGVVGIMNGVSDNYQLQWLLMGLPELNDEINLTQPQLEVVKGLSQAQGLEDIIQSKWNMYNWQYVNQTTDDSFHTENWIWSEGIPLDISKHDGYRIILLGKPSYDRTSRVQRMFYNLLADLNVQKTLNKQEVHSFLKNLKEIK